MLADKAYDADWIRNKIWEQGVIDVIPSRSNRKIPKELYQQSTKIERFFCRLKASFRRITTRYEQTSANFSAMIRFASVRRWLEFYEYAIYNQFWIRRDVTEHSSGRRIRSPRAPKNLSPVSFRHMV